MPSARSPRYPGLHDEESGVHFLSSKPVEVSEEQALALANRRYVDGILIGEFDEEGRAINEQPAKDWRKMLRREDTPENEAEPEATPEPSPDEATTVARQTRRK